jgi:hypothetical protein
MSWFQVQKAMRVEVLALMKKGLRRFAVISGCRA